MFSTDNFNPLVKEIISRLSGQSASSNSNNTNKGSNNQKSTSGISITPSQALVIAGIVGGVLDVSSVSIDKEQLVLIVLSGSLKQKTELERMMDQIGQMPFEEVMKVVLGRLT